MSLEVKRIVQRVLYVWPASLYQGAVCCKLDCLLIPTGNRRLHYNGLAAQDLWVKSRANVCEIVCVHVCVSVRAWTVGYLAVMTRGMQIVKRYSYLSLFKTTFSLEDLEFRSTFFSSRSCLEKGK